MLSNVRCEHTKLMNDNDEYNVLYWNLNKVKVWESKRFGVVLFFPLVVFVVVVV